MISPILLSATLIYYVWQWWSLYLNMCVAASASEALEALVTNVPFSLEQILVDLEGGIYLGPVILEPLEDH